ncbi:MAG: hypothetical protein ACRCXZ_09345 [Patescibacteria group bacterium]
MLMLRTLDSHSHSEPDQETEITDDNIGDVMDSWLESDVSDEDYDDVRTASGD